MGTFGIVLLFLIKLRDMALAHMERRLMVHFTKFHLQSKNWLEKSWLDKLASYFNQKVFFQLKKKPISHSPVISFILGKTSIRLVMHQ